MTQPEMRSYDKACASCPYSRNSNIELDLPDGEVQNDVQRKKIESEIEVLKVREQQIREMRQLREDMVRNYLARKFNPRVEMYSQTNEHK